MKEHALEDLKRPVPASSGPRFGRFISNFRRPGRRSAALKVLSDQVKTIDMANSCAAAVDWTAILELEVNAGECVELSHALRMPAA